MACAASLHTCTKLNAVKRDGHLTVANMSVHASRASQAPCLPPPQLQSAPGAAWGMSDTVHGLRYSLPTCTRCNAVRCFSGALDKYGRVRLAPLAVLLCRSGRA